MMNIIDIQQDYSYATINNESSVTFWNASDCENCGTLCQDPNPVKFIVAMNCHKKIEDLFMPHIKQKNIHFLPEHWPNAAGEYYCSDCIDADSW